MIAETPSMRKEVLYIDQLFRNFIEVPLKLFGNLPLFFPLAVKDVHSFLLADLF
jgi:hypothetical protein